jgi:DNA/RNA-binding domain of Phe-tRNA-synthetase-like protein
MDTSKFKFAYHQEILETFSTAEAGVMFGRGLANQPTPEALKEAYFTEQARVIEAIGDTPLSELEPLSGWRGAFRQFGVNPTKYRSAIEALLRRLTKKGDIPSINALVDIGNLVSIRYRVPVAMFDAARTGGEILVQFAQGDEPFTPLFKKEIEHPEPGEVIFVDGNDNVAARRWCWRQSNQSASRPDTTMLIAVTEAHHPSAREDVQAAITDMRDLIAEYLGGELSLSRVGPGQAEAVG